MLQRSGQSTDNNYRYGFQGQEEDNEVKGDGSGKRNGNSVNYRFRMHDPRLGRFFAVDPLTSKYPHYTPYSFSGNKVIHAVELEGLEEAVLSTYQHEGTDSEGNSMIWEHSSTDYEKNKYGYGNEGTLYLTYDPKGNEIKRDYYGPPTVDELAKISNHVYEMAVPADVLGTTWRKDYTKIKGFEPYGDGLSYKSSLYSRIDKRTGGIYYVYAHAGTDDVNDAIIDLKQAVGFPEGYYAHAAINGIALTNHFGFDANITLTGHSLGGGLTELTSRLTGYPAVTFNAAALNNTYRNKTAKSFTLLKPKIDAYIVEGEIVNYLQNMLLNVQAGGTIHLLKTNGGTKVEKHLLKKVTEGIENSKN